MSAPQPVIPHRLLVVHAHPDDESIGTGATMAKYAAVGAQVTLVTCTLGEEGEVLVDELEHLTSSRSDQLGDHRREEFAQAMAVLGVADWRFLGGAGKYRDSGMRGEATNDAPSCFWRADLLEAARDLVQVIREVRPQVVVTYDENGAYGHPDHIQAHRVTMYAAQLAAVGSFAPDLGPPWSIAKIYWTAFPKSVLRRGIEALRAAGDTSDVAQFDVENLPFGVEDDVITTVIDGSAHSLQKVDAMRCYPTQIDMESGFFSMWELDSAAFATEYFRLVHGPLGPVDQDGREDDLFAGLRP